MTSAPHISTAAELLRARDIGRCELIRGELITMSPAGGQHGAVAATLAHLIRVFVKARRLGIVCGAETGFLIERDPDTVRAPDVAFIAADRAAEALAGGFIPIAPDLAVEVLSPDDRAGQVGAKVEQWLRFGCRAVWVVDPVRRLVTVHEPSGGRHAHGIDDEVSGGAVLPGLILPVAAIFEDLPPPA